MKPSNLAALPLLAASALAACVTEPTVFDDVEVRAGAHALTERAETSQADAPAAAGVARVTINELESTGGSPGDWVELINTGEVAADLSGWRLRDNLDAHAYVLPAGTVLPPGGFLVLDEARFGGWGLGAADSARLYDASGALVDSYAWTTHASTTLGRCADGTGAFRVTTAATRGAANACAVVWPTTGGWPGPDLVRTVDSAAALGTNVSDLVYAAGGGGAPDVLWAVRNEPSLLYRLVWNGSRWAPDPSGGWSAGKRLRFPGARGRPDAEGMTRTEPSSTSMYVVTERDNDAPTTRRASILRYDTAAGGAELVPSYEWDLTDDLPAADANLGPEALAWVPDAALTAAGFVDPLTGAPYQPALYPDHGSGLFLVGLETTGAIHAYALDYGTGGYTRLASFSSGLPFVTGLRFDRDSGYLWAQCDNGCGNRLNLLAIDRAAGRFRVRHTMTRPGSLPDGNHEGVTMAPDARCAGGVKPFFWTDDSAGGGHALRADAVPCGAFLP